MQPKILSGVVTKFKGDGRRMGYATANLAIDTELEDGVYFGFADLAAYHHHPAIIFIGTPTTLGETTRRVEAHLIDIIDRDYYDQNLIIEVRHYHRPNQTFPNVDSLLGAIKSDEAAARHWFTTHH